MNNRDEHFIVVQHRPRRVAFLVDVDQSSDILLNEIVDFNVSSWGGRYNPIIPVLSGQIAESYWQLLELVNPDILYTYCDLSTEVLQRIIKAVRPLDVLRHDLSLQPQNNNFRVGIDRQATVVPVLARIMGQFPVWARKPEPAALVFDYKDIPALSSFVRRNFGGNSHFYFWCRDHQIPSTTLPPDDKEVMKALTSNHNLVLPINVCAEGPRKLKASTGDWGNALTMCYGTSPWNFVEYWNLAHFLGEARGAVQSLSEMWMKPALLEDGPFYEVFLELIRRRVFVSEHQHYLRLISYDESEEHMREVTKRICADFKWGNMHPAEPIVRKKGELPAFEPRPVIGLFRPRSTQPRSKQVSGNSSFLELSPPADAPQDCDERWIAEFAVENSGQERYFANKTAWWKLPQKDRVASLFVSNSSCRVGNDYLISTEVSGEQQGVILNTPDLKSLFATPLCSQRPLQRGRKSSIQRCVSIPEPSTFALLTRGCMRGES